MSDGATLKKVNNAIADRIAAMLDRKSGIQAFLNTNVYKMYQNAQRKRWMTENQSQGSLWKRLDPVYSKSKTKRFAAYPGGGRKMLIATGRLQKSVIGPGEGHRKITTTKSITILTNVRYAQYVDEVRDFTEFSPSFKKEVNDKIKQFLTRGKR